MNVVIYGRVSTHSQDFNRQVEELKEYCDYSKYSVSKVFTEIISGAKKRSERKEINKLLEYIKTDSSIRGVLVWELSRLGRNTADVLSIINELNERKIWVYSKKENLYTLNNDGSLNPTSQLTISILSGVASHERETTIQRSISGLREKTSMGRWVGGANLPYGYKRDEKKLVIEEVEANVVKLIFNLYLEGLGTQKIANELNKKNIKTRFSLSLKNNTKNEATKWRDATIYRILTNTIYIGEKKGKGNLSDIKLYSPKIIEKETFNKVQHLLKNKQIKRTTKYFYLFENKIKCGRCKRPYYPHKRANNSDNRFVCLSKRYNESCDNFGIGIPKINDGVWSVLRNNKEEIDYILNLNRGDVNSIEEKINELNENIKEEEKQMLVFEKQERQLVDLLLSETIDKAIYTLKFNEINLKKSKSISTINDLKNELDSKEIFRKKQSSFNNQLRNIKDNKRILKRTIDEVINRIVIYPINKHNLSSFISLNQQDKFVFVEIFTYLNETTPLIFVVSQRSDIIITPKLNEFNKEESHLKIGGFNEFEDEEEEPEIDVKKLFHLTSLD